MDNKEDSLSSAEPPDSDRPEVVGAPQDGLIARLGAGKSRRYVRFLVAALGSIPWVGGLIAASASLNAESEQQSLNELLRLWLEEHKQKLAELGDTLAEILVRLDKLGDEVQERIESPEYLALVRKAFRSWDQADTQEKKQMFKKLIANASVSPPASNRTEPHRATSLLSR
jgi:hypothetical protein